MDIHFELNGDSFVWDALKAGKNLRKFASSQHAGQAPQRSTTMLTDRLKARLSKHRPMTSITVRVPVDVVESMKLIAPLRGFSGYQALLKSYLSEGLRRDEAQFANTRETRLIETLKRLGVSQDLIERAAQEVDAT